MNYEVVENVVRWKQVSLSLSLSRKYGEVEVGGMRRLGLAGKDAWGHRGSLFGIQALTDLNWNRPGGLR